MKSGQRRTEGEKTFFNAGIIKGGLSAAEMLSDFMMSGKQFQQSKNVARKAKRKK